MLQATGFAVFFAAVTVAAVLGKSSVEHANSTIVARNVPWSNREQQLLKQQELLKITIAQMRRGLGKCRHSLYVAVGRLKRSRLNRSRNRSPRKGASTFAKGSRTTGSGTGRRLQAGGGACTMAEVLKASAGDFAISADCLGCLSPCTAKNSAEKNSCALACTSDGALTHCSPLTPGRCTLYAGMTQPPTAHSEDTPPGWGELCVLFSRSMHATDHVMRSQQLYVRMQAKTL